VLADPRPLAVATQVLILVSTLVQVVLALTVGTKPKLYAETSSLAGVGLTGAIVVFLCWFRRCRLNAEVFAPAGHRHSARAAVWTWFVPGVMWWAPRRIMLDIWRASGAVGSVWVINAWWVAWLANSLGVTVCNVIFHARVNSPYVAAVHIVAAALAVLMIRQVTAAQDGKAREAAAQRARRR
jgi:hypothetical protein